MVQLALSKKQKTKLNQQQIYEIYVLQSRNVRELGRYRRRLKRRLNDALRDDQFRPNSGQAARPLDHPDRAEDRRSITDYTRLYALVFSAWSEAQLVQILHTPNSFCGKEIQRVQKKNTISAKWKQMISIAFDKSGNARRNESIKRRTEQVEFVIDNYIFPMSQIRNKIAHGQWIEVLNGTHTAKNTDLTRRVVSLDHAQIDATFGIHEHLGKIVRDLMQSPHNALHNNFAQHWINIEVWTQAAATWSVQTKDAELATPKSLKRAQR